MTLPQGGLSRWSLPRQDTGVFVLPAKLGWESGWLGSRLLGTVIHEVTTESRDAKSEFEICVGCQLGIPGKL